MSNLNKLNEVLFETLEKVQNGTMDDKKASAVVQLSNSIINNGKLQLAAYKFANSGKAPEMFGLPEGTPKKPIISETKTLSPEEKTVMDARDKHATMLLFSNEKGHKNMAEAIGKMGKDDFMSAYNAWLKE